MNGFVIVGQEVLQHVLLFGQQVLGGQQIRAALRRLRFGLLFIQGRQRADLHLLLVFLL